MIENQIGKRFAEALSDSIADDARVEEARDNLRQFHNAMELDPQFGRFFLHPSIPDKSKADLVMEFCDRIKALKEVRNLMKMLVERQKMSFVKNVTAYFEEAAARRLNQARVQVVSAHPLSDEHIKKLKTQLDRVLGKSAQLETHVDESLVGGLKLSVGSLVADASIKNALALLKQSIEKEEVLSEFASG